MRNRIQHNYPSLIHAYELFTSCASLIYFSVATVTITTKPKNITFATVTVTSILLATKYFAADIKLSRCG